LAFGQETGHDLLLAFSGIVTALPLILFSFGARRLPMSAIGLINYMTPSLQFLVGVAYGEPLTPVRIVSFAFIWLGLLVFTGDSLRAERARRRAVPTAP
jgi:chloramphenicol-sensitive protein RarD